ncbi:LADA_0F05776g1_1 [Lachancea dasiensis]|uniref:LADA_0F05776g1_1 n=1 Tax=Lachancea dasiensis TaxID=1072105 RepID=A0A1G4JJK2_9SACH|nr:LADA_0F05776g1_1 [Lachancea dasiensis]
MGLILDKRYIYNNNSNGWLWGRWLLFIVVAIGVVLWVFGVNVRRRKYGRNPIRGTAWLAPPPSYGMSQNQYNIPGNQNPVPEYSATANVNDAGFFDESGKFHRTQPGQPVDAENTAVLSQPEPAVTRDSRHPEEATSSSSTPLPAFQRPDVPPPASTSTEHHFQRPEGPPPVQTTSTK